VSKGGGGEAKGNDSSLLLAQGTTDHQEKQGNDELVPCDEQWVRKLVL